ncbi:MAG: hypothetical protein AB8F78_17400 [Saprospiraceae bacterium]
MNTLAQKASAYLEAAADDLTTARDAQRTKKTDPSAFISSAIQKLNASAKAAKGLQDSAPRILVKQAKTWLQLEQLEAVDLGAGIDAALSSTLAAFSRLTGNTEKLNACAGCGSLTQLHAV